MAPKKKKKSRSKKPKAKPEKENNQQVDKQKKKQESEKLRKEIEATLKFLDQENTRDEKGDPTLVKAKWGFFNGEREYPYFVNVQDDSSETELSSVSSLEYDDEGLFNVDLDENFPTLNFLPDFVYSFYPNSDDEDFTPVNALIKGIPPEITAEEIEELLSENEINPIAVQRIISKKTYEPLNMMLVQVPEKNIEKLFEIEVILDHEVSIEIPNPNFQIIQCFQCKKFGHMAIDCEILRKKVLKNKQYVMLEKDSKNVSKDSKDAGYVSTTNSTEHSSEAEVDPKRKSAKRDLESYASTVLVTSESSVLKSEKSCSDEENEVLDDTLIFEGNSVETIKIVVTADSLDSASNTQDERTSAIETYHESVEGDSDDCWETECDEDVSFMVKPKKIPVIQLNNSNIGSFLTDYEKSDDSSNAKKENSRFKIRLKEKSGEIPPNRVDSNSTTDTEEFTKSKKNRSFKSRLKEKFQKSPVTNSSLNNSYSNVVTLRDSLNLSTDKNKLESKNLVGSDKTDNKTEKKLLKTKGQIVGNNKVDVNSEKYLESVETKVQNFNKTTKDKSGEEYLEMARTLKDEAAELLQEIRKIRLELSFDRSQETSLLERTQPSTLNDTYNCESKESKKSLLNLCLNGLPTKVETKEVLRELNARSFNVKEVYRLKGNDNKALDEVVFQLPEDEDHIYFLSCLLGFEVSVVDLQMDFSLVKKSSYSVESGKEDNLNIPINVVIKNLPIGVPEECILSDLRIKKFNPIAIHRMVKYSGKVPLPMVIVQVPGNEEHIFDIKCLLGFSVCVKKFTEDGYYIKQCNKCQQFGHISSTCTGSDTTSSLSVLNDKRREGRVVVMKNMVIKGVPIEFDDQTVANDLKNNSFNVIAVHRMIENEEVLPNYIVKIPRYQHKSFARLSCCLGFSIDVEYFLPDLYAIEECDICNQFGHESKQCVQNENSTNVEQTVEDKTLTYKELGQNKNGSDQNEQTVNCEENRTINKDKRNNEHLVENLDLVSQAVHKIFKSSKDSVNSSVINTISGSFSNFLESTIAAVRKVTEEMMEPDKILNVTTHTLNEQLHFLEELEDIQKRLVPDPGSFAINFEKDFPAL